MKCYCHRIPKYRNDMRKIREMMGYVRREIVSGSEEDQPDSIPDHDDLLEKFGVELIHCCQSELNRLEEELAEMETKDQCYHESESSSR